MLKIDVLGMGRLSLKYLATDFNGTLAVDGKLIPGVAARLDALSKKLMIHVVTSDTHDSARIELRDVNCKLHVVSGARQDFQKHLLIKELGADGTVSIGNGQNDRRMLKTARLGICIIEREGASAGAMAAADICVSSIADALDMLLHTDRLKATLRLA